MQLQSKDKGKNKEGEDNFGSEREVISFGR
jgi:hypothetical protein